MIRLAFIGLGAIARDRHLPEAAACQTVSIVGCWNNSIDRAQQVAAQYGCLVYSTPDEAFADDGVDAVVISTPNSSHAALTIAALRAGKHVLCEKPMATTVADGEAMVAAAATSGKLLMIGHNLRLEPAFVRARELLDTLDHGGVLSFASIIGSEGPEDGRTDVDNLWFFRSQPAGTGVCGDLAIHAIDTLQYLLGEEFADVVVRRRVADKQFSDGRPIEVEDSAAFLLSTASGITGTLLAGWCLYDGWQCPIVLYCRNCVIRINDRPDAPLVICYPDGRQDSYSFPPKSAWEHGSGVLHGFVSAVECGDAPTVHALSSLAALRTALT